MQRTHTFTVFPNFLIPPLRIYFLCVHMCTMYMQMPVGNRREHRSPGIGVTVCCKPPHGCWALNLGSPKELQALLTAESSLWVPSLFLYFCFLLSVLEVNPGPCTCLENALPLILFLALYLLFIVRQSLAKLLRLDLNALGSSCRPRTCAPPTSASQAISATRLCYQG